MAVVKDFRLPDLGEGLEEGEIVEWYVEVGDVIDLNQTVADVETAKAVVAVPSPFAGTVVERHGEIGQSLEVGVVFLRIEVEDDALVGDADGSDGGGQGEDDDAAGTAPAGVAGPDEANDPATGEVPGVAAGAGNADGGGDGADAQAEPQLLVGYGQGEAAGRRRRGARGNGAPAAGATSAATALAKPPVRKLAKDLGVDLDAIAPGSGPDGVITRADVLAAARGADAAAAAGAAGAGAPAWSGGAGDLGFLEDEAAGGAPSASGSLGAATPSGGGGEKHVPGFRGHRPGDIEPIRGVRRRILEKMVRARTEIPDASASREADLTELWEMRHTLTQQARDDGFDVKVTPFALVLRAAVIALRRFPVLNSRIVPPDPERTDDRDAGQIHLLEHINLGFAVDTDRGVVVPNIKDAHARSTLELATEASSLAAQARDGSIGPGALTGGTFTVNNYGAFGVDYADPILNAPEAAMLGIGAIRERPWVVPSADGSGEGTIAVRRIARFTLVFDHRVCDGGEAGRFLSMVAELCERPGRLLLYL